MEPARLDLRHQPLLLRGVDSPKSWGSERWLNAARPEAGASILNAAGTPSLAEALAAQPELLGEWARRLYGDELPIFTKLLRADFPPLVHVGFRVAVDRQTLTGWLAREQALLRQLLASLRLDDAERFGQFAARYAPWATAQARASWQLDDDAAIAAQLAPLATAEGAAKLPKWLGELRRNRAHVVAVLNEVDLRREDGNLLLTAAGMMHAIFGLSHQTHPLDHSRPTLQQLLRCLRAMVRANASDADLREVVERAPLAAERARNLAPPKNEGWLPLVLGGQLTLVEPQQSSDTTYSLADFYTPFVWDGARTRFRKGDAAHGLRSEELEAQLRHVELGTTSIDKIRRRPKPVALAAARGAQLFELVDEADWPFFTGHRLELDAGGQLAADHGAGLFQQLIAVRGAAELTTASGQRLTLDGSASAFVPGTLAGGYRLSSREGASVLAFSLPGPHGSLVIRE